MGNGIRESVNRMLRALGNEPHRGDLNLMDQPGDVWVPAIRRKTLHLLDNGECFGVGHYACNGAVGLKEFLVLTLREREERLKEGYRVCRNCARIVRGRKDAH